MPAPPCHLVLHDCEHLSHLSRVSLRQDLHCLHVSQLMLLQGDTKPGGDAVNAKLQVQ